MDSPHCCLNWLAARSCNLRCRQRGQLSLTIEVTRDVCLLCIFPISNCTWILAPQHPDQLLLPLLLLSSWSAAAAAAVTWPCRTLFTWHLERCTRKACRYENIKRREWFKFENLDYRQLSIFYIFTLPLPLLCRASCTPILTVVPAVSLVILPAV